jgi:hypothetical protein
MELKNLLLKTSQELDDNEKTFIREHEAELNDEDRDAYKDFLQVSETPLEKEKMPAVEPPEEEKTPTETLDETPAVEQQFSFKSEEEAKAFVAKFQEEQEDAKQKAINVAKTPEEKKYVDKNWKPDNWNEGIKKAVELAKEEIRQEEEQKQQQAAVKYWNDQWAEISAEKKIPALTTPEGSKIHKEIIHLMQGYGLKTFQEGYEMREKVVSALEGKPIIPALDAGATLAKSKIEVQKKAAGKIGKANAGDEKAVATTGVKPFASYEEMGKTSSRGILRGL